MFAFSWAVIRLDWADLPANATWAQFHGVTLLCGIGFTMSLFIGLLAFPAARAARLRPVCPGRGCQAAPGEAGAGNEARPGLTSAGRET
ncbi:Na+/H+ antiporter NhaA [Microvirga sp. KLBC 81]|uniref:Na+/H+ antiporter NhaA n=1 Tax=Microvirga sp. KLBC 81 TaxID=1862707 RepID=UPI0026867821